MGRVRDFSLIGYDPIEALLLGSDSATFLAEINDAGANNWTPVFTASGAMTVSGLSILYAKTFRIGKLGLAIVRASFTLGGVVSTQVKISLAANAASTDAFTGFGSTLDATGEAAFLGLTAVNNVSIFRPGGANWTLGAGRFVAVGLLYELANPIT